MENYSEELMKMVVSLAEKAGKAIMEVYSSGSNETTYKEGGSPLTAADLASHNIILKELNEETPEIPVLSEESKDVPYEIRKSWKSFWLVDPLDGTKEFIKRNGEFTVNIALINEGETVLGVVHVPVTGVTYSASKGKGAFKKTGKDDGNSSEIRVSDYNKDKLKVVASRSHGNKLTDQLEKKVGNADFISMGSSLKLCLVAEGTAHLYPRLGPTMEWDTAAAQCVVESAGGSVTDLQKKRLGYNKPDLHNPFFIVSGNPPFPWWDFINNTLDEE